MSELIDRVIDAVGDLKCPIHDKVPEIRMENNQMVIKTCCPEFREQVQKIAVNVSRR